MTRDTLCLEELEPRILLSSDGLLPIDDASAMEARESTVVHDVVEVSALNPDLLAPLGAGDVIDAVLGFLKRQD